MDPEPQSVASALLTLAFFALNGALFVAVVIGLLVKGPVRWVKILAALLLLSFLLGVGVASGFANALTMAGVMAAIVVGSMAMGMLLWSQPRRKTLQPTSPQSCPSHAKTEVDKWSSELHQLGFAFHSDQMFKWRIGGSPRSSFVRLFSLPSEPIRAELHALDNPKAKARVFVSRTVDGRNLVTCDQQSDAEHFRSQLIETRRVASRLTTQDMLDEHRAAARELGGGVVTGDPVAAHLDGYHRWVDDLVENGVVAVRNGSMRVKLSSMPGILLRVLGAWFH